MEFVPRTVIQKWVSSCSSIYVARIALLSSCSTVGISLQRCSYPPPVRGIASVVAFAKERGSSAQPLFKKKAAQEEEAEEEEFANEESVGEEFEDEEFGELEEEEEEEEEDGGENENGNVDYLDADVIMDDDDLDDYDFEDDEEPEASKLFVGDGGAGGGISLAGTWWDKEALALAEEVSTSFDGVLKIYAFKTSANSIRIRIENLSIKSGSPSMSDIEAFSNAYRSLLDKAESAGKIPNNVYFEVSSPGVERVVRIPEELERFKERPMFVKYIVPSGDLTAPPQESDGVLKLVSLDMELCQCTWAIADVKVNRQQAGKGRPLNRKQRDWRLQTHFENLRFVRLHSDC